MSNGATTPLPPILAYSPDRPYTGRTTDWNTGCPVGYFAEIVAADAPLAVALPNGVEGVRCRLVAAAVADIPTLANESYSWEDTLANLNAAILEATPAWPWWVWVALALGAGFLSGGTSETRVFGPAWLGLRKKK